ncbi:MAG: DUF3857 domain-containing protein [Candidatus Omnitrophica bacterium]|nr:DUF3857 domain-containing protein [Candidatus Omnitrophota bacterium]
MSDEAGIIYFVDEEIEITEQNTSVSTLHIVEQVLKERGKDLAEVEIGYDSTYERVELEFARTVTPDGRVIYAGKESMRDVSKYLNFPLYSNARAFIISMPSVEVGSFIEYKLKIYSSKLINKDDFSFIYKLRENYPIFNAKFKIVLPKDRDIRIKFFNEDYAKEYNLNPCVKIDKDKKIYSWDFNKITPIIPENNMPNLSYVNPAILISSFNSWDEIYQWWWLLCKDKFSLDKNAIEFVNNLVKDLDNEYDKAKRIYEFCAKEIRYVAVEYGESGHEPHYAWEVFLNRYGDCKDQAILLVAMLRTAGLKAYPVLIPTEDTYPIDLNFPSVNFNHAIACVDINDKLIFMDPTAETVSFSKLPFSDQDRDVLVFEDESWQIIRTPQSKDNEFIYEMYISIDEEENANVSRTVTTNGVFSAIHRAYLKYTHPSRILEDIQKRMVEISSFSRLVNYKILNVDDFEKSPILNYQFFTEKFLNPAGELRIIPVIDEIHIDPNLVGKEKRDFSIDFATIYTKKATIKIELPPNLTIKYLPNNVNVDNRWFGFETIYTGSDKELVVNQKFEVNSRFVYPQDYQEFKRELERVIYFLRSEVILEKSK